MTTKTTFKRVAMQLLSASTCLFLCCWLLATPALAGPPVKKTQAAKAAVADPNNPIADILTAAEWDVLFPHRFNPDDRTGAGTLPTTPAKDFYSYANLVEACKRMAQIKLVLERRCGTDYYRITRTDKATGVTTVMRTDPSFNDPTWANLAIVKETLDYASFANEGDINTRKRELLAFLANISQETTGGWPTAPGGQFAWGLYFREEQGYEGTTNIGYRVDHAIYPPAPGKSYHGRGPIQLSYNYNYGQASEFLFGDKNILLANPEKVIQEGVIAFETGIWFWMTPQYPKPSCHDVMIPGKWTPTPAEAAGGLKAGFGTTVNIINGGVECGGATENNKVLSRIGHFQRYTGIKQVSMELNGGNNTANLGCANMKRFAMDPAECSRITALTFTKPASYTIATTSLSAIAIEVSKNDPSNEVTQIVININGQRFTGTTAQWTPPSYGKFKAYAAGARAGKDSVTTTVDLVIWNNVSFEGCTNLPAWQAKDYTTVGNIVLYNGSIYRNKWWAGAAALPSAGDPWELLGACSGGTGNQLPVVNITAPANNASYTAPANITISANATDADGRIAKVEFFNGATKLGETTTAPYNFAWNNVAAGNYSITAKATDDKGGSRTSAAVTVAVNGTNPGGGCGSIAVWDATKAYTGGQQAVYSGKIYKAKWWTQGDRPDQNTGSGKAWEYVGDCGAAARSFSEPTHIGDDNKQTINVYPNPATGSSVQVTVDGTPGEQLQISLLNIKTGQPILRQVQTLGAKGQAIQLNISQVPAGTWILSIQHGQSKKVSTAKIVRVQ